MNNTHGKWAQRQINLYSKECRAHPKWKFKNIRVILWEKLKFPLKKKKTFWCVTMLGYLWCVIPDGAGVPRQKGHQFISQKDWPKFTILFLLTETVINWETLRWKYGMTSTNKVKWQLIINSSTLEIEKESAE